MTKIGQSWDIRYNSLSDVLGLETLQLYVFP